MDKKNIIISLTFFFIISLFSLVYFVLSKKGQESFYVEYSVEYDKNFIDNNFYNLNIATQIPLPDYKRGITSFKYCSSKSECKEFIEEINNIIIEINKSLWNVTEGFIGKYMENDYSDNRFNLRLKFLEIQKKPVIIMLNYKIVENGLNKLFTNFFKVAVITFILSLILFMGLNFFSSTKGNKK